MNPIKAWKTLFFGPISARPIGLFRIVYGLVMVMYLTIMTADFELYYTSAGLLRGEDAAQAAGPFRLSLLQFTDNLSIAHAVHWGTLAAAIAFTLGWHTRIASILLYAGMITLYHRNVISNGGPDAMPTIMTFYTMLCPCGKAYSIDAWLAARKQKAPSEPIVAPWGIRLLQMQICLLYFQSCVIKCQGTTWSNGTVMHYVLHNREFGQFDLSFLAGYPLIINAFTHGALLIEFALAFWLWFRPTRRWAILGGILLHAGIRPVIVVPCFGETMIASYITFLAADEVESLLRALDPRRVLAWMGLSARATANALNPGTPTPAWQQLEIPFGDERPAEAPAAG